MNCPEPTKWQLWLEGDLSPRGRSILAKHLDECPTCRGTLADVAVIEQMVQEACQVPVNQTRLKRRVLDGLRDDR